MKSDERAESHFNEDTPHRCPLPVVIMADSSAERMTRSMSVQSRAAVDTVEGLKSRLAQMEERLRNAATLASSEQSTVRELLEVKLELAQMVGTFEKFQFNEVDAVVTQNLNSGKDEVRRQRKALTQTVMALGEEAARNHTAVVGRIEVLTALETSKKDGAPK